MNAKDAWLATLGQLQIQLNRATYDTWLRHAELIAYEEGRFVVSVPHSYAKDWLERHLQPSMEETLSAIFRRQSELQFIVYEPIEDNAPLFEPYVEDEPSQTATINLNPAYTLQNFVIGQSNHYAALLARAIVDSPLGKYSPVLFCGDMGMGKTHLLQAIARALVDRGKVVVYMTAEDFTNEMVAAIRGNTNSAFREKYRMADAVLIDDTQFIEGKNGTQNELVAIWDTLRNRQRTMIFASDRVPSDMTKISRDMRSRLQAGPIANLEMPDYVTSRAMLVSHCERRGLTLPSDVIETIANQYVMTPRDLEGVIEQFNTYSQLTGKQLTSSAAYAMLQLRGNTATAHERDTIHNKRETVAISHNKIAHSATSDTHGLSRPAPIAFSGTSSNGSGRLTLEQVFEATARYYNLTIEDVAGRSRTKVIALARQLAMYLARETTTASLVQIGEALGRDHSTVMHGCAKIAELIETDIAVGRDLANIRQSLAEHVEQPMIW